VVYGKTLGDGAEGEADKKPGGIGAEAGAGAGAEAGTEAGEAGVCCIGEALAGAGAEEVGAELMGVEVAVADINAGVGVVCQIEDSILLGRADEGAGTDAVRRASSSHSSMILYISMIHG